MSCRPGFPIARSLALSLGLAAAVTLPAIGQQLIALGQAFSGQLAMSDPVLNDGSHYDAYMFYGQAGQFVQIDVMSSAFDSYVILQDQSGNEMGRNDDGGGGLNARLQHTLPYTGSYRIIVNSYRSGGYGPYTVQLTGSGGVAVAAATPGGVVGTIGPNQQVSGTLSPMDARWDNKPFHSYTFQCNAGQPFQMDVLSSWDNYALVFDPMGNVVARDDDTGEGLNARVNYTCTFPGVYRLAVTTYTSSTQPGPYTLQVQSMGAVVAMQPTPMPGVTMPAPVVQALPLSGGIPAPGGVGTVQFGQMVQGRLETGDQVMNDGTWADVWQFQAMAGQTVTIELRSEEFDTYLQLLDGAGNRLAEDDDSLGNLDSRIVYTLPAPGMYQIVINNFGDTRRSGIYTVTLR